MYSLEDNVTEINCLVLVPPMDLEGMANLRKIMLECESEAVLLQASELFHEIYDNVEYSKIENTVIELREEFIQYCLDFIKDGEIAMKKRAMIVLKNFMEECDKHGTSSLKPHNSILKGDSHYLKIVNNIKYLHVLRLRLELKVSSNTTIWELRNMIGEEVNCFNDQFCIFRGVSKEEIKDNKNGKTLSELGIGLLYETLTLRRRSSKIARVPLVNENLELTPKAASIFEGWFFAYADNGDKMSLTGFRAFASSYTVDHPSATYKSIQKLFLAYDHDRDGLLAKEDFLEFYKDIL